MTSTSVRLWGLETISVSSAPSKKPCPLGTKILVQILGPRIFYSAKNLFTISQKFVIYWETWPNLPTSCFAFALWGSLVLAFIELLADLVASDVHAIAAMWSWFMIFIPDFSSFLFIIGLLIHRLTAVCSEGILCSSGFFIMCFIW